MRFKLEEISVHNLREFIEYCDKQYNAGLSGFSLISLRLTLQLIISEQNFQNFSSFFDFFKNNLPYQKNTINNLFRFSNELFRDAEDWFDLINDLQNLKLFNKIAIYENGNYSDLVTFLISLKHFLFNETLDITIIQENGNTLITNKFEFTDKQIENGILNYEQSNFKDNLKRYFKNDKNKYYYYPDNLVSFKCILLNEFLKSEETYDLIIARNITLKLNHLQQQIYFNNYIDKLKKNGVLFTGKKEGFKWCAGFERLYYKNSSSCVYKKLI